MSDAPFTEVRSKTELYQAYARGARRFRVHRISRLDFTSAFVQGVHLASEGPMVLSVSHTQMDGANLDGLLLHAPEQPESTSTFFRTDLERSSFVGTDLRRCTLQICKLDRADFTRARLSGASVVRCKLQCACLKPVDAAGCSFEGSDLSIVDAAEANLSEADLSGCTLTGADLRGADLRGANLRGANLRGARLEGADLRGADLRFTLLPRARLLGARVDPGSLRYCAWDEDTTWPEGLDQEELPDLLGGWFRLNPPPFDYSGLDAAGLDLKGHDFLRHVLEGACFDEATLDHADLRQSNLKGASFVAASLRGADLSEADLTGADISGADLRCTGLMSACLEGVLGAPSATWPTDRPYEDYLAGGAATEARPDLPPAGPDERTADVRPPRGYPYPGPLDAPIEFELFEGELEAGLGTRLARLLFNYDLAGALTLSEEGLHMVNHRWEPRGAIQWEHPFALALAAWPRDARRLELTLTLRQGDDAIAVKAMLPQRHVHVDVPTQVTRAPYLALADLARIWPWICHHSDVHGRPIAWGVRVPGAPSAADPRGAEARTPT